MNDEDTQRLRRSELVLKKFGLLPRDFNLETFLVALLREEVAGYYDPKTKTVNLIDWVPIDPRLHAPLNQATAVVRRSPRPELGLAFIQFVNGPEGRPIMKRYGFLLPGEF